MGPVSISDYRLAAKHRLPRFLFEYIEGGAGTEQTLTRNALDLQTLAIRQRVLTGVGAVELGTKLLGQSLGMPVVLAPIGLGGLSARRGEIQAARAARSAAVPFTLSTLSVCPVEEVAHAVGVAPWFQLYVTHDRGFMRAMLARAKEAGCRTLLFTVDMAVPGIRYRDLRSGLAGGSRWRRAFQRAAQVMARPAWAFDVGVCGRPLAVGHLMATLGRGAGVAKYWEWIGQNFDPTVTWRDIEQVRELWEGPLVIKGVLEVQDARHALAAGAEAIVVSNHGGRQLDGASSTIRALPAIVDAVGDRLAVLMDGGIRSGADVVRALACGARAVLLGRPWVWGLGARGEAGVAHVLDLLAREMRVTMALMGASHVSALERSMLYPAICANAAG